MKKPFKTSFVAGDENVMVVTEQIKEIRFNRKSRALSVVIDDTYTVEDLDGISWLSVKKLVISHGGEWVNKKLGIEFMVGRSK